MRPLGNDEAEGELTVEKISPNSVSILDHCFTFDAVAGIDSTQEDIFRLIGIPLVENCLAGFNSTIFAYGQTGSGKTYTMWGPLSALHGDASKSKDRGLTPCVFERLFARIEEEQAKHSNKQLHCQCRCSFLEIYNEQITDLLDPTQRNLQIREDTKTGVYVDYLTEEFVSTMKDVTELLMKGLANRRTGATSINIESSRSHCVFTCVVEFRSKSMADGSTSLRTSRINLVDLAGSERQKQTGAGGERLKEAGNINRSLSQLGNLINILAEVSQSGKQRHIPYRDSKLTFLLQESLGGNAKMAMICAVSPSQRCKSETFSTLRFAQRAKAIKNKAVVNEVTQDDVNVLREQIRQLKDEILRMKSNGTSTNGSYSTSWNARRSLSLLKMSLNLPTILPVLKDDSDEEMEIDENDVEMPCHQGTVLSSFNRDKVPDVLRISKDRLRSSGCRNVAVIGSQAPASPAVTGSGNNLVLASEDRGVKEIGPDHGDNKPDGQTFCLPAANVEIQLVNNSEDKSNSNLDCIKMSETNSPAEKEQLILADQSQNCLSSPGLTVSQTLSIVPCQTLQESPASVSPLFETCSRNSLRTSSSMSATDNKLVENFCSSGETLCISKDSSYRASKNGLLPTEQIEASLHHGLRVIDSMQHSSALRRSSFKFPVRLPDAKSILKVDKFDVGAQTLLQESGDIEKKNVYVCCYCKSETLRDEMKDETDGNTMQLVPVEGPVASEPEKLKIQVPKAVEKVLAGSIRREMALEEHCAKQASEIRQLNRLVEQFKHERECNALIAQTREEKISRLEKLMDGSLPKEDYIDEEFISLANEYKLLKEKYNKHPEALQADIELKRMQKELDAYQNFFDLGEREILMEEIQYLRSQLQCYIDSSSKLIRESSPLLQLTNTSRSTLGPLIPILESIEETADEKDEDGRKSWTEKESKWISLTEELTLELEASRTVAEKLRVELDIEKKCTEELKEALQTAMQGHARILEQYADLQEMHVSMLARERRISEGIEDVKRAAAKAGVKGAESKFIHSLATEISVLRAEREKERRYWKDENKGLQAQLRDTAEAVQAAGELLVRLKEAEEAVVTAKKRALLAEQNAEKAYQELDNLKKNYKREAVPLKQCNDESHLSSEILRYTESNHSEATKYNDEESINDQRWKEEFEDFSGRCDTESSKDIDPKSWFFGYDRCNI